MRIIPWPAMIAIAVALAGCASPSQAQAPGAPSDRRGTGPAPAPDQASRTDAARRDDLNWLVGRWRCYGREYLDKREWPLGTACEDSLDYFNVYFPFADDHLTLALTDEPRNRPIAAEFLVRLVTFRPFGERLWPMEPGGLVQIGKDRIVVSENPFEHYEFHYRLERTGKTSWLILESKSMRLRLFKCSDDPGDVKQSMVVAPLKGYSAERISALAGEYEKLSSPLKSGLNRQMEGTRP